MEMHSSSMKIHQLDINSCVYKRSKDIAINFQWVFLYLACAYIHLYICVIKKTHYLSISYLLQIIPTMMP